MYVRGRSYHSNGQQVADGLFLILFHHWTKKEMRAVVRRVKMVQLGHFMMGSANIGGHDVTLSGSYGADGLANNIDHGPEGDAFWEKLIPLPQHLYDAWNKGGGHNGAGTEGPQMKQWALDNMHALYNVHRPKQHFGWKKVKDGF